MAGNTETSRIDVIINGQKANQSLNEMRQTARLLNAELGKIPDPLNSPEFEKGKKHLDELKNTIRETTGVAKQTESSISNLANGFNKYFGVITAGVAAFSGVVFSIKEMIQGNAKLSDSLADVRKTTGLSMTEVKSLYSELGKLNTRTSRAELLELASVAGKLGYSVKEEVLGFVKAADQINVALAKDLGGNAEEAINSIGKLTDIFKIKDSFGIEQAMLKTGSAINALGAASSANEAYIVEFTKRLGGIAPQAGLSIENIMGLAATLDQLGQQNETSSTAISQLITKMFQKTSEFAKIAGVDVAEFSNKLKTDANSALIMFLNGLQKNQGGLQELAENFKDLGIDGSRAISVIGVLANNTKMLADTQKLSNEEFLKGTSLTNEFNVKNENMAGNLEKIGKNLKSMFVNSAITSGMEKFVGWMAKWFDIPLSEKMAQESIQVNALASQITDANLKMEERKKIYDQLNAIAPSVLEGIDKESIAYNKLTANLEKYNEEMVNRIIIQKQQEKIDAANQVLADHREDRLKQEALLRQRIMESIKANEKVDPSKAAAMKQIMMDENKTLQEKLDLIEKQYVGNNMQYNVLRGYWKEEKEAQTLVTGLIKEKNSLMSELNIGAGTDKGGTSTSTSSGTPPPSLALDPAKAKENAEYIKKIQEDLQQSLAQGMQIARDRDLKMAELDYKKKLQQIKGQSKDEEALRLAYKAEYERKVSDINKKYSDEELKRQQEQAKKIFDAEKEKWVARIKADDAGSAEWFLDSKQFLEMQEKWELDQVGNVENAEQLKFEIQKKYMNLRQDLEQNFNGGGKSGTSDTSTNSGSLFERSGASKSSGGFSEKVKLLEQQRDIELEIAASSADKQKLIWQEYYSTMAQMISENMSKIINTASFVVGQLSSVNSAINDYENAQLANDQAANDKKKENLKERFDKGLITQKEYNKQVETLDKQMNAKKKALEIEQAKRQHKLAIMNAMIGMAQAILNGLNTQPFLPLGIAMGALAGVLGGVQLKYVMSTPVPQAAGGRYNVIGQQDGRQYNDVPYQQSFTGIPGRPMLVNETGNEMVIDPATTRNLLVNYPEVINAINYARVPQRAAGYYPGFGQNSSNSTVVVSGNEELMAAVAELNAHLKKGITSKVVWQDLDEANTKMNEIKKDTTL